MLPLRSQLYIQIRATSMLHIQPANNGSTKMASKKPIGKGQRIIMVPAGSKEGFVSNALLMFRSGTSKNKSFKVKPSL